MRPGSYTDRRVEGVPGRASSNHHSHVQPIAAGGPTSTVSAACHHHTNRQKAGVGLRRRQNYRPISNLTYMSKFVERLVCKQVTSFLEENNLLPRHQSGFRARHSTETAVLKVMSDILAAADDGRVALLGLLDMSAAFDTVDHHILLQRLESSFGLTGTVLSWLASF